MKLQVGEDVLCICRKIQEENWTEKEWAQNSTHDWFQHNVIEGGYDDDEKAFLFNYYDIDGEWYFQFSLEDVPKLLNGDIKYLKLDVPDRW